MTMGWDLLGSPVVRASPSKAGGEGSIPDGGAKIHMSCGHKNQNTEQKQYCNKFNNDLNNGPHQKSETVPKLALTIHWKD